MPTATGCSARSTTPRTRCRRLWSGPGRSPTVRATAVRRAPWLYKIATNRCLTAIQRRGRRRELPTDLGPGSPPLAETVWLEPYPDRRLPERSPEATVVAREQIELAFVAALQHLSARQRAVLLLRDVLGFSAVEAATQLDTSVAAVNSALQRARRAMDELRRLRDHPAGDPPRPRRRGGSRTRTAIHGGVGGGRRRRDRRDADRGRAGTRCRRSRFGTRGRDGSERSWWRGRCGTGGGSCRPANGQLAFGTYLWDNDRGAYVACALDLVALRGPMIAEVVSFLDPALFPIFGLRLNFRDEFAASRRVLWGMTDDEKQIRQLIERWAAAVHRGDLRCPRRPRRRHRDVRRATAV